MTPSVLHQRSFVLLVVVVSLAFGWILQPFFGSVFWAAVLALVFAPFHRRVVARVHGRRNLAAILTLTLTVVGVILPVTLVSLSLVKQGSLLVQKLGSGEIHLGQYFEHVLTLLPQWALDVLERLGLDTLVDLREKVTAAVAKGGQALATQALSIGQNTFEVVLGLVLMLYVLFFLLRDGRQIAHRLGAALPLSTVHKRHLLGKFATVIRATVKGNVAVACSQGALGGLIFWVLGVQSPLLWGVVMAILSLLPAVGAGLIWLPVALYLLATGAWIKATVLIAFGVLVIGLVDNVLRPILVGKDTQMPDYLVLISTLGGLTVFGVNGFVIGPLIAALFIAVWDLFMNLDRDPEASPPE